MERDFFPKMVAFGLWFLPQVFSFFFSNTGKTLEKPKKDPRKTLEKPSKFSSKTSDWVLIEKESRHIVGSLSSALGEHGTLEASEARAWPTADSKRAGGYVGRRLCCFLNEDLAFFELGCSLLSLTLVKRTKIMKQHASTLSVSWRFLGT